MTRAGRRWAFAMSIIVLAVAVCLGIPGMALAAEPGKVVIAWNPSHQDDTGPSGWHEYLVCGDIVKRTIALLPDYTNVLCWETGMGRDSFNYTALGAEMATANASGARLTIGVHTNSGAASGLIGEYYAKDSASASYADRILGSMAADTGMKYWYSRARSDLYSLDPANNRASMRVILELGDCVNDRTLLESESGRQMLAAALAKAVRANTPPASRYEQGDSRLTYAGSWTVASSGSASGGSFRFAGEVGATVTIPFWGTHIEWIAKKGPSYGRAKVTLDAKTPVTVDLYSPTTLWQQNVWDPGALPQGDHSLKIEWTGVKSDPSATGASVNVDAFDITGFIGARPTPSASSATRYEQTSSNITRSGTWTSAPTTSASAGSYSYADSAASAVIWFIGDRLDWIGIKSPGSGKARVVLDGSAPVEVDLHGATVLYRQRVWSTGTLPWGTHWVKISWTGLSGGGGTRVNMDAVDVWGGLIVPPATVTYQQNATGLAYAGSWTTRTSSYASGSSWTLAKTSGSSVTVRFVGSSITWLATRWSEGGVARVTLDGGAAVTVDLYRATPSWKQSVWATGGLRYGKHTVKIEWTGTPGAGGGTAIDADAFVIQGTLG